LQDEAKAAKADAKRLTKSGVSKAGRSRAAAAKEFPPASRNL
jgi:hypothetical protein